MPSWSAVNAGDHFSINDKTAYPLLYLRRYPQKGVVWTDNKLKWFRKINGKRVVCQQGDEGEWCWPGMWSLLKSAPCGAG
jgi:hypothetical protein